MGSGQRGQHPQSSANSALKHWIDRELSNSLQSSLLVKFFDGSTQDPWLLHKQDTDCLHSHSQPQVAVTRASLLN